MRGRERYTVIDGHRSDRGRSRARLRVVAGCSASESRVDQRQQQGHGRGGTINDELARAAADRIRRQRIERQWAAADAGAWPQDAQSAAHGGSVGGRRVLAVLAVTVAVGTLAAVMGDAG